MPRPKPVLKQQIFEARYEQGYRYLDRCGDAMIILEQLLGEETGCLWLPKEMSPTSANLHCPDLDISIVFNAYRFVIDRTPVEKRECDFDALAEIVLATIVGRFDLRNMQRFGARRLKVLPKDSVEEAEELSVKLSPVSDWRGQDDSEFEPRSYEIVSVFELPDRSKGVRVTTKPYHKVGAALQIDERLKSPPHYLHEGQREALVAQLKRDRKRQDDPEAGLVIDIDYFWLRPAKEYSVKQFIREAWDEADRLEAHLMDRGGQP